MWITWIDQDADFSLVFKITSNNEYYNLAWITWIDQDTDFSLVFEITIII